MAFVLPHAAPPKVPAASVPLKSVPLKAAADHPTTAFATKFQALLDQSVGAKKPVEPAAVKVPLKAKAPETPTEKPKEPKKAEAKDHRSDADVSALMASMVVHPPKVEAPKPASPAQAEAVLADAKAKAAPKVAGRTGADAPAPVTAAAVETARHQVNQNAPRNNNSDRTEDKQKVFVVDRRSDKEKEKARVESAQAATPVNAAVEVQTQAKPVDQKGPGAEVQVQFQTVAGKGKEGFDLTPQATVPSPRDALTFQQYLVDKGYGQLVDQARIVLKDQNAGEIRMTLYPESLGKVKVALNLEDSSLAGQIFVENQTVKDVFQANLDGLVQSFQDGGWNDVSLQVQVGGDGQAGNGQKGQNSGASARDYGRQVVQSSDGPAVRSDRIGAWTDRQINLTA